MDNPCKDCRRRLRTADDKVYDCHDHCDLYLAWKYERSEILNRMRLDKDGYTDHDNQPYWKKHKKSSKRGQ